METIETSKKTRGLALHSFGANNKIVSSIVGACARTREKSRHLVDDIYHFREEEAINHISWGRKYHTVNWQSKMGSNNM